MQQKSKYPASKPYPDDWIDILTGNAEITNTYMNGTISESFDRFSDEYPSEHIKVIHTYGSVAKVQFVAEGDTPYTGLFKGGIGVIRMSLVKSPEAPCKGVPFTEGCFAPGIAIKLLRDGTYSSNFIAMTSLGDGQGQDYNFFKNPMKIWVPQPTGVAAEIVMDVFAKAAAEPFKLASQEMASMDPNGDLADAKSPSNVYFVPPSTLQTRFKSTPHEFRADMVQIESGTTVYEGWAPGPDGCLCDGEPCLQVTTCQGAKRIGRIVTTSSFTNSRYGDASLFFQHERGVRKTRSVCAMAKAMPNYDVYRMSGNAKSRCLAGDASCDSGEGIGFIPLLPDVFSRRRTPGTKTVKCPFS